MLRALTLALALFAIVILLGSSVVTFMAADSKGSLGSEARPQRSSDLTLTSTQVGARPTIYQGSAGPNDQEFQGNSSASATFRSAQQQEFKRQFSGFIEGLDLPASDSVKIESAMLEAYLDAAELAKSDNPALQDPNFVLNAMGLLLDPAQLASLEQHMIDSTRAKFETSFVSQIEIISPDLDADSKALMVDTLFDEYYAITNPHGAQVATDSQAFIEQQLAAIARSRDSLRGSLSAQEFTLANKFLLSQESSLSIARTIFSTTH